MSEETKYTPTPWHIYKGNLKDSVFVKNRTVCGSGVLGSELGAAAVAYCDYMYPELAEANDALIVRAVNNHAQMLAALRAATEQLDYTGFDVMTQNMIEDAIKAAEKC